MEIGAKLKNARAKAELTQKYVADAIQVTSRLFRIGKMRNHIRISSVSLN